MSDASNSLGRDGDLTGIAVDFGNRDRSLLWLINARLQIF